MAVFFLYFVVLFLVHSPAQWLPVEGAGAIIDPAQNQFLELFFNATQYSSYNHSNPCSSAVGEVSGTSSSIVCDGNGLVTQLRLPGKQLKGQIPSASIGRLTSLTVLDLSSNGLYGDVPGDMGHLPSLMNLSLSINNFSSQFASIVGNLTALQFVDLSKNQLAGNFSDLSNLGNLRTVRLGHNFLTGELPTKFPPQLTELDLTYNGLSGSLPPQLLSLVNLKYLNLRGNNFDGNIGALPPWSALKFLNLSNNNFAGSIPELTQRLEELQLYENRISGEFPSNFNTSNLTIFDVHDNQLNGSLPNSIPESLTVFDVHGNNIHGNITAFVNSLHPAGTYNLSELDLSANSFSLQAFPSSFNHFTKLEQLSLAGLKFQSHPFPTVGSKDLQTVNFSHTNLSGPIPSWFVKSLNATEDFRGLDLSGNSLSGTIPPNISILKKLEVLDLSDNTFSGQIPADLTSLTFLSRFNVSYNNLTGRIPSEMQFSTWRNDSYLGNPGLCGFPLPLCSSENSTSTPAPTTASRNSSTKNKGPKTAGLVAGIVVILIAGAATLVWCRAWRTSKRGGVKEEPKHVSGPMQYEKDAETWASGIKESSHISVTMFDMPLLELSFADLHQATANFSKDMQIADGGYGPVYRGVLPDSTQLAIKVLVETAVQDDKNVVSRIEALGKIRHANLVPLVGYCLVGENSLLIYDYMVNGDLQRWLHELPEGTRNPEDWSRDTWESLDLGPTDGGTGYDSLNWPTRHKIGLGAARGLAFLHHGCSPHVIHRDVKSSNVLLDENFEPHLVDCGLAGIARTSGTPIIGGTLGYVPPEYGQTWQATTRGDVYSFGVVLLELVTGRQPTGHYFTDSCGGNLVGWVRSMIKLDKRGQRALDPSLLSRGYVPEMLEALRIGYLCTAETPAKRPTMQQVVGLLKDCQPGQTT